MSSTIWRSSSTTSTRPPTGASAATAAVPSGDELVTIRRLQDGRLILDHRGRIVARCPNPYHVHTHRRGRRLHRHRARVHSPPVMERPTDSLLHDAAN